MFEGVSEKLERAAYFLNNLKSLAEEAGALAHVKQDKQQGMRANLDGFFFEIISAKDFFLQGINDKYAGLAKNKATDIRQLKIRLKCKDASNALKVVELIDEKLHGKDSWLWKLKNYRDSATHRELLHFEHTVNVGNVGRGDPKTYLFEDPEVPSQGHADIEVIPYCEQSLAQIREYLETLFSQLGI